MNAPARSLTRVAALAAAALVLTACTGDPEPGTSSSGSTPSSGGSESSSQTSAAPSLSDQSSLVTGLTLPPVQGTATGTLERQKYPATLNVATVVASPSSTVLTFWLTGQPTRFLNELSSTRNWTAEPTLVDTAGKKIYQPVTYTRDGTTYCLCTNRAAIQNGPQPRTVVYPKLPDGVTSIQVRMPGFSKPIPAKVTRIP